MRKLLLILALISVVVLSAFFIKPIPCEIKPQTSSSPIDTVVVPDSSEAEKLYNQLGLFGKLKFEAFEIAMAGYENLSLRNRDIITVIDFTLPSTDKRLYVIDLKNKKLLFHSIVSHGRNSGEKYATSFSNRHGSYQSSLGFYVTEHTYQGGNGYSLVLNGLEKGINDQAKPRAVVIHGADYASQRIIEATGRLGRSYGCPALPRELAKPIINTIKDGTMLFIYADNAEYMASSSILKSLPENRLAQRELPDVELPGKALLN